MFCGFWVCVVYWEFVWISWINKGENREEGMNGRIVMKENLRVFGDWLDVDVKEERGFEVGFRFFSLGGWEWL